MKKLLFIVLLLGALVLSACTTAAAPVATAAPTNTTAPTVGAGTEQPVPIATSSGPAACKAGTEPLPLPVITDEDWSKGPNDAKVTILEYSDFQ